MVPSKKNQEIINKMLGELMADGFTINIFGNAEKKVNGIRYRYIFNSTFYRQEVKIGYCWMKINGAYYKDIKTTEPQPL